MPFITHDIQKGKFKAILGLSANCIWTNAAGTNYWNNAGNWSCGSVPTNANNVIFDGAVTNAPIAIDVTATAASFTVKGTNLPTTGDIAYTGTITANQNLTLDTANGGTGSYYLGAGTYVANATTITVPKDFTAGTGFGTFTYGTSTVILTGTSTINGSPTLFNLNAAANGKTTTVAYYNGGNISFGGVLTLGDSSSAFTASSTTIYLSGTGTPLVTNGAIISALNVMYTQNPTNITGTTYNATLQLRCTSCVLDGNITSTAVQINGNAGGLTTTVDTNGKNITTSNITIGSAGYSNGVLKNTSITSTNLNLSGSVTIAAQAGADKLLADNMTINVAGNFTNSDTFTAGNSTVNFNGAGTQTLNSGGVGAGKLFNNLTHSGTGTLQLLTNAYEVDGTFSQAAGTFNANALNQTYKGNFSLTGGTYTKGGTLTFAGTTSFTDANANPRNIGAVTLNGISLTVTSGTMQTDALTVTTGDLIQTAGNIKTTGAVSVAAGQNWTNNGTGDVTLGGNVTNAGTVTFNGDESATGAADPISILSTATSARTWTLTGAGTFSFTDVSVSYQTGATSITATSSNDGGNNTNWIFATNRVISGSIFDAIGGSKITSALTIAVSVNGAAAATVESSNGDYTLTLGGDLAANDIVSVFISGETEKASAITKTSVAASGINIDLFQNCTVIRHEGTIAYLSNSAIAIADNVSDSDLLVTADGSNVATFTKNVYIQGNKTYAPLANTIVQGNWVNYGVFAATSYTVIFSAASGTQTVFSSDTDLAPYTGTNKSFTYLTHSGAGTLQLTSNLDVEGTLTNSSGPLDFNDKTIFETGDFNPTGSTITGGGTLTFDGNAGQTFTTAGLAYNNITLNNYGSAGATERITVTGNLDINGALTIADGSLYLATSNPNVNTSGNVSISALGLVNKGTGTWTFDGTTTYTDLASTKSNIGTTVVDGTSVTLASSMTVDKMTVTSGTLDLGNAGYTLSLVLNSNQADVLSVSGTLTVGTNSIVQYRAVNSAGNVNVLAIPYDNLQFTPISGSESYNLTGNLTDANAMVGNVTIDANATLNTYVGTTSYDISCVTVTINASGVLYSGTNSTVGTSTFTVSGNWNSTGTFTFGLSTINLTGTGTISSESTASAYNVNAAAAGNTTTITSSIFGAYGVLTLGTGTLSGTSISFRGSVDTPLVTSGALITTNITYFSGGTKNVASTTYSSLSFYGNVSGIYNLAGPITATTLTIGSGNNNQSDVVNSNDYNINCTSLILGVSGGTSKNGTLNMGSGTLTVSGDVLIHPTVGTYHDVLSFTSGTANIGGNFTNNDTFTSGTGTVNFTDSTKTSTISGTTANTFYNLTAVPGKNIVFPTGVTQTIAASGSLGFTGSTAGMVHLRSSVPGTQWNISVPANQNVSYVDVKDSAQTNGTYTITDTNGSDGGNNNAYWQFSGTGNRYWVAPADGNWNSAANWSASSGGSANASVPTSGNVAIFDQPSGAGSYAATINTVTIVDNISVAGYTNTLTINALTTVNTDVNMSTGTINAATAGTVNINGDLLLSGTAAFTAPNGNLNIAGNFSNSATFTPGTGTTIFISTGTGRTITSGTAHFYNLVFNGTGGNWTMADNSTTDNNFTITAGTVSGGATILNVGGSWNHSTTGAIFAYGTSTVNITGTGTFNSGSGAFYYNLNLAAAGNTTSLTNGLTPTVTNFLTLGTGTLAGASSYYFLLSKSNAAPLVNNGVTVTGGCGFQYTGANQTVAGGIFGGNTNSGIFINGSGTMILAGDLTTGYLSIKNVSAPGTVTMNADNHNITVTADLSVGRSGQTTQNGVLTMGSGSLTVSGVTTVYAQTGSYHNTLDLGSGTHYFGGNFVNSDYLTAGTSTAVFNGTGTQTLNSGGVGANKLFNNLTHSGTGTLQLLTNNLDINGNFSQTAGTFNANARNQNFAGDFSLTGGAYTKGGTLTFDGTTNYSDTNATPLNIGAVTMSGTSVTVASGTMQVDTIALTAGSLIQTEGGVKTTSTITTSGGTNWTNNGRGAVILGGNVTNAGTLSFDGDEATYGADPIAILSTAASARTWALSGAGTFSFTDVSVSYQSSGATINVTSGNDGGNNTNWIFATNRVISGSLFDGIGGSKITDYVFVAVSVNGAAPTITPTDTGDYSLTLETPLAANDIVSVYIWQNLTIKASAITKTSIAASGINIDLFQNYTAIRHEGTITSLAYSDLAVADDLADSDLLFSVDGSNIATFTQGIYILNNKTYAPGANIVVQGNFANYGAFTQGTYTVTFDGTGTVLGTSITSFANMTINNTMTLIGHATNMNVSGNFLNNGTYTHNSGTLTFNGAAGQTFTDGGQTYNNVVLNNTGTAGANERITVSGNLDVNGNLTITDGALYLVTNNPTVNVAGNVSIASVGIVTKGSGAWTFDGATATTFSDLAGSPSDLGAVTVNKTNSTSPSTNDLLTVSSNMTVSNLTIDGTSGQEDTLSIASGKTITQISWSITTIQAGATISGAGTLKINDNSGPNLSTTGTLNSAVQFAISSGDINIPARTYGGNVTIYQGGSSNYNATLGTSAGQTLNFSGNLTPTTGSTGTLTIKADTYNPTINITGNYTCTKNTGLITTNMGTGNTWTVSGNWDVYEGNAGVVAPGTSTMIMNGVGATYYGASNSGFSKFYNFTVDGTVTMTAGGTNGVGINNNLTINSGRTLTIGAGAGIDASIGSSITISGTLNGSGVMTIRNNVALGTGGILDCPVGFWETNSGTPLATIPARTFGGLVTITSVLSNNSTTMLGTGAGQTITFNAGLVINTSNTGFALANAATYNPNVIINGNLTATKASTGVPTINMGSGSWTVSGNVNLANMAITPGASTLNMNNANGLVTQTLDNNDQTLNNLTHSGAGTLQLINHALTLNGTLTNSAGFFNANNLDLTIAGSLNNTATMANTAGSNLTFNGTSSSNTIRTNGAIFNNVSVTNTNANLNSGLMGYWKLDEGAGTSGAIITDSSGNGNTGTMTNFSGSPWTATTPGSGYYGADPYALNFTAASSQYLSAVDNSSLNVGTGSFTVGAWVKPTSTANNRVVNKWLNSSALGWFMDINENGAGVNTPGYVRFQLNDGTHLISYFADGSLGTGAWKYVSATVDQTNHELKLFVNGNQIGSTQDISAVTGSLSATTPLGIGSIPSNNGYYFGGGIDDVRLYNRVLGGTEITGLYNGTNPTGTYQLQDSLTTAGNMTITAGTLDANGNNMTVGGNWSNSDTFTPGANTVTFNKSTGTQTLNSGGVGAGKLFNNVTHSGAGSLQLTTNSLNIDGNLINSAGTLDSNSIDMTLAGNYNSTGGTVTTGSSTVTFDGAVAQSITSASQPFYNLTLNNTGSGTGDDITPADALDINGTLTITDGQLRLDTNNINTTIAGDLSIASGGTLTKGTGTTTFDGSLTASTLTDSASGGPQNLGAVVITKNNIILPTANLLTLNTNTNVAGMSISADNILDANGQNIADSGNWTNSGTFTANTGTVTFNAGSSGKTLAGNMTDTSAFNNITFDNASGSWTLSDNIKVASVLNINAGTLNASSKIIELNGGGTPFVKTGTFTKGTSTVKYTSPLDTTITAADYHNLDLIDPPAKSPLTELDKTFTSVKEGSTELTGKRNENQKVFQNPDGKEQYIIGSGPMHYQDGKNWQEINTQIASNDQGFEMLQSIYKAWFNRSFADSQDDNKGIVKMEKDGYGIVVTPGDLAWDNGSSNSLISVPQDVSGETNGNKVTYKNAYGPGLDFTYQTNDTKLTKNLTIPSLDSLPKPSNENTNLSLNLGFNLTKDMDIYVGNEKWDGQEISYKDKPLQFKKDGKLIWQFLPPKAWDSSSDNIISGNTTLTKSGQNLSIVLIFPYTWLKTAQYPVTIDPDTYYGETTDGSLQGFGPIYTSAHSDYEGYSNIPQYIYNGQSYNGNNYGVYRSYIEFDTSGIDDAATVSSANLYLTVYQDISDTNFTVRIHEYTWTSPLSDGTGEQDYDGALVATTNAVDWRSTSGMSTNTPYASQPLRTAYIEKGATKTQYALLSNLDVAGTPTPTNFEYLRIYPQEYATQAYRPYLSITAEAAPTPPVYTMAAGTFNVDGNLTIGNGVDTMSVNADTNDPDINIAGNFDITANATFDASNSGDFNFGGDWENSGIFTSGTGTVTLNGSSAQTITAGGTDDDHDFYNLTVTNSAGPTNGVTFADSMTLHAGGTFTDVTPDSKLIFTGGETYNFPIININGDGTGDVTMTTTGGDWNFIVPGAPAVTYVTVDHSNATGSGAQIDATSNCTDGAGGGTNTYWDFGGGPTGDDISGSLYDAIGGSKILAAKTINCSVNGDTATTVESASGDFTVTTSAALAANDIIVIYVSGETEKASTVTKVSATGALTGIDLFQNYTTIRHEGTITEINNTNLGVADNLSDSDILFSGLGIAQNMTFTQGLYVLTGKTYRPGSNTTATNVNIAGTFTAESGTHTYSGDFVRTGTFNYDTSTVDLTGTGNLSPGTFYNLTAAANSKTTTITNSGTLAIQSVLTTGNATGTLAGGGATVQLNGNGTPFVNNGAGFTAPYIEYNGSGSVNVAGGTYWQVQIPCTNNASFTLINDLTVNNNIPISFGNSAITVSFDTNGHNLTTQSMQIGSGAGWATVNFKPLAAGTIAVNTGMSVNLNSSLDLSSFSGTFNLGGNFVNSGTFTAGTSTVNMTATNTGHTINPGASSFYNLTFNGSGGAWSPLTNTVTVTNDLTMTAGTFDTSNGTANVTVNGNVACGASCGIINMTTTNTFTQNIATNKNFGTSVAGTTAWTFYNLSFARSAGASTITTSTVGSGDITVNNLLGMQNGPTLDAGNRTWHLMGSGTAFSHCSSPFTANTSTLSYENTTSANITGNKTFYNLQTNPASGTPTYTLTRSESSFLAGTKVATPFGNKNIEDIQKGDEIISYDQNSHKKVSAKVTNTVKAQDSSYLIINRSLRLTPSHPVITALQGGIPADKLNIGDQILGFDNPMTVEKIETVNQVVDVYDLSLDNYFVFYADNYLVHNICGSGISDPIISNNFTLKNNGGSATVTAATNNVAPTVNGNFFIEANQTFVASMSAALSIKGNYTNAGTFTHSNGTVTFNGTATGKTITPGGSHFNNLIVNSSDGNGVWTAQGDIEVDNDLSVQAGKLDLGGSGSWYNGAWQSRKPINITGQSGVGTNYQIAFNVGESAGATAYNFHLDGEIRSDFNDLIFTDNDGTTVLPYWIESISGVSPNQTAKVWVKVADDLGSNQSIYVYYNNPLAIVSSSNGTNTFDFFDDFSGDLSKWVKEKNIANITQASGYVQLGGGSTSAPAYGHSSLGSSATYSGFQNGIIEGKAYASASGIGEIAFRGNLAGNTGYKSRIDARAGQGLSHLKPPYTDASWAFLPSCTATGTAFPTTTWTNFKISANGTSFTIVANGATKTCTDASYSSAGEIALQNHYGSYVQYDDIRVRKYAATEPSFGSVGAGETSSSNAAISGDFSISGGEFDMSAGTVLVGANWSNSGGTVTEGTSTVQFTGTTPTTFTGSTTFNNLVMNSTTDGAKTITFPTGTGNKQVIAGTWTLDGDTGKVLTLASATPDTAWYFDLAAPFTSGDFINVKDSWSADTNKITPGANVTNSGNNDGWIFAQAPNVPTDLLQKKVTGGTTLATGDWTGENQVQFTALVDDDDTSDTLYLCVEKDPIATALSSTNGGDLCGTGVAYAGTPVEVSVTITGMTDATQYHWQAQVKDASANYSSFVGYGGNTENPPTNPAARDFGVDTTAPTGGTVNDGTSTDVGYNEGSLTELSANWSNIDSTVSGLQKYEYAIGTTAGATNIKDWTNNTTNATVTASGLILQTGQPYYFSVRTTDNAGNLGIAINSNGQQVLPTLSFNLNSNTITFANLNSTNGWKDDTKTTVATTSTNAASGYAIKAYTTQVITSLEYPSKNVPDYAGTWTTPTVWADGTYGFGYTSYDTLVQSVNRFLGGTKFAGFGQATSGDVVADHTDTVNGTTGAVTDEGFTIKYKIAVSPTQEAASYSTKVIYTITANY